MQIKLILEKIMDVPAHDKWKGMRKSSMQRGERGGEEENVKAYQHFPLQCVPSLFDEIVNQS